LQKRCLLLLLVAATAGRSQTIQIAESDKLHLYKTEIQQVLSPEPPMDKEMAIGQLLNILHHPTRLLTYALPQPTFEQTVSAWERARLDEQIGANAVSSGTTNLVSRPSTPTLLGLAVETGGLTESISGSVATFRGNADGLLRAAAGAPIYCLGCPGTRGLKNVTFSLSYDLSRTASKEVKPAGPATTSTPAPSTFLLPESNRQLSSFSARYDIYNPRDVRSKEYQEAWKDWFLKKRAELTKAAGELIGSLEAILDPIAKDPRYIRWRASFHDELMTATQADILDIVRRYMDELVLLARSVPDFDRKVALAQASYARYAFAYEDAIRELNGKAQFTFEYTYALPQNQPIVHNFRLVAGFNPHGGKGLLTANLAATIYGTVATSARYGRLRDLQAAAQFDRPLGGLITHPAVLTLAGYYQYQFDPSVINIGPGSLAPGTSISLPKDAAVLLGSKGSMAIVQAKVTIKMKDTGVKIPIGISWSNRTELIKATDVRGHVGLTYDLDSLLTR
jgi:hypothetical protein